MATKIQYCPVRLKRYDRQNRDSPQPLNSEVTSLLYLLSNCVPPQQRLQKRQAIPMSIAIPIKIVAQQQRWDLLHQLSLSVWDWFRSQTRIIGCRGFQRSNSNCLIHDLVIDISFLEESYHVSITIIADSDIELTHVVQQLQPKVPGSLGHSSHQCSCCFHYLLMQMRAKNQILLEKKLVFALNKGKFTQTWTWSS